MVGIFTFILGFFRLGFLDSVLSRALLRGFVTAVALVVSIEQSQDLLGIKSTDWFEMISNYTQNHSAIASAPIHMSPISMLFVVLEHIYLTHIPTAIISGTCPFV